MVKLSSKGFIFYFILILILLNNFTSAIPLNNDSSQENHLSNNDTKKWTIMLYDNSDFLNAYDPLDYFALEAYSNININALVLQDKEHGPATLWYIDENHNKISIEEMGEINMGNFSILRDFITYCKNNYTAHRYMLFFSGHGHGWMGAGVDFTPNKDILSMNEMQQALTETNGVDIVCFSAPCLMGAVESAYELRNCTKIYIGSESISGYTYWNATIGDIFNLINNSPDISDINLGKEIVNMIKTNLYGNFFEELINLSAVTISAIDTSKMEKVAQSIDQFARFLSNKVNSSRFQIKLIRFLSQHIPFRFHPIIPYKVLIDIYDFSKKCYLFFPQDKEIQTSAKAVMDSIDEAVIANLKSILYLGAHGLSIFFPNNLFLFDERYINWDLDLINDTDWDEFITLYLN